MVVFRLFHVKASFFVIPFMIKEESPGVDSQATAQRPGVRRPETRAGTIRRICVWLEEAYAVRRKNALWNRE